MKYDQIDLNLLIEKYRIHIMRTSYDKLDWIIPMHNHSDNSYEIHYIAEGKGILHIDDKSYPITPHTLFVTGPLINHEQIPDADAPMMEYCFNLWIEEEPSESSAASFISQFVATHFWIGQDTVNAGHIISIIFEELRKNQLGVEYAVTGLVQFLFVLMTRLYQENTFTKTNPMKQLLLSTQYCAIEDAFLFEYKDITIEQLASRLSLSVRQTERLLQTKYQNTFQKMKLKARMSAAIALLQAGHTVEQTAERVGYSSIEHFCRAFKKYFGASVTQYRTPNDTSK